jgi:hypothetical protein
MKLLNEVIGARFPDDTNAEVHFQFSFHDGFLVTKAFIERRERSPSPRSARRTPGGAGADPFLTDRGCSGFRVQFAPHRDRERRMYHPGHIRAVKISTLAWIRVERSDGPNGSFCPSLSYLAQLPGPL